MKYETKTVITFTEEEQKVISHVAQILDSIYHEMEEENFAYCMDYSFSEIGICSSILDELNLQSDKNVELT